MRRCLLVDDNRAFAENLAEILRDDGADVTVCHSGLDALDHVKKTRFDVLVTDMRMPVMSGATLVHEIRRIDVALPAIVVSAYTGETDLADARSEGLLAVLPKPVPIAQLQALASAARRAGLVAIIDDDAALSDNLSEILRARGFTAVTARSALEAERLGNVKPFAVVADLRLPDAPRGEVLAQLAARFPGLDVVVMTGFPELLPRDAHPTVVLPKPFSPTRLLEELEKLHAKFIAALDAKLASNDESRASA